MYILYQKYSNQANNELFIEIIRELKWMILRDLKYVDYQEREDFRQALYLKIHEVLLKKPIKENDDFKFSWSDNEEIIIKENKYLLKLLSEFGMTVKSVLDISILNDEEREFLDAYEKALNQTELAERLHVTQQAVSKRYNKIIKKLKESI